MIFSFLFCIRRRQMSHFGDKRAKMLSDSLSELKSLLNKCSCYAPVQVTDELMGIKHDTEETRGIAYGATWKVVRRRKEFLSVLGYLQQLSNSVVHVQG